MHRRHLVTTLALAFGIASSLSAQAGGLHVDDSQCGFDSNYDVQVTSAGIDFTRHGATPAAVFMHDGELRVDGTPLQVSADDAARLRAYEGDMRALLPQMAGIAQEAVGIAFDSLATVAATLDSSAHRRDAMVERINRTRRTALHQLDAGINADHWSQQGFEQGIEQPVTEAANELASSLTRSVLWSVFTGHADDLQARADSLDESMDKEMHARADKLEAHAKAICPRLTELEQLQQQFHFRLADGSPLRLVTRHGAPHTDSQDQAGQLAER